MKPMRCSIFKHIRLSPLYYIQLTTKRVMLEYPVCSGDVGSASAINEIALRFFNKDVRIEKKTVTPTESEYTVVLYGDELSVEEHARLQQLCLLNSNQLFYKESPNIGGSHTKSITELSSASSTENPYPRPDTLLVKNIPSYFDHEAIKAEITKSLGAVPIIHSLVRYSEGRSYATITFPEEDSDFPSRLVENRCFRYRGVDQSDFQYDNKFIGITPLFDAEEKAEVDLIALVGLGTHAFGTFRSPEGDQMWLRDFLKHDIPNIRVLLYGYDSIVDRSKSVQTVHDLAVTCLNIVHNFRARTSTLKRPIIFLGQSLGGLIVQELLVTAEEKLQWSEHSIFTSWYGLVGFGIPTRGLNNETLKEAVMGQPNETLIRQICSETYGQQPPYLKSLATHFERCCRNKQVELIYFQETNLTRPKRRNLGGDQEILMVRRGENSFSTVKELPIATDHSGMVKYRSSADPLYIYVMENIRAMVENCTKLYQAHSSK
ncbi:hypothetical protein F5884DRAFT_780519 [Xylogone sp. PMI_703]|nr:hypothetical protein F5884DRAFT_780519 [Xylogone sp. PMI_703]